MGKLLVNEDQNMSSFVNNFLKDLFKMSIFLFMVYREICSSVFFLHLIIPLFCYNEWNP